MKVFRIAIIFDNFGPYHWARVEAAARYGEIFAIEVASASNEYAWNRRSGPIDSVDANDQESFPLTTECLFDGNSEDISVRDISRRLGTVLNSWNPHVVFIPGWSNRTAIATLHWCMKTSTPAVLMSETTPWDDVRKTAKEWIKRRVVGTFSAALVGGSAHADYLAQLGFPRDHIFLGYDAVDNHYFSKKAAEIKTRETEIRNQYGLPKKFFLASARFIEKKNLVRLLHAYARYRELAMTTDSQETESSPWGLVLLGDGPLREKLSRIIVERGLQSYVQMPGFKQYPDLPAYYATAGAFIHASTTEQWGLVVNEAMASGLPVLVSNRCGCARELVREGENGFTFDPFQPKEMALYMLKIADKKFPRDQFGAASQQIIAHWGPDRFASGLHAAVNKALEIGPIRPSLIQRGILSTLMRRKIGIKSA